MDLSKLESLQMNLGCCRFLLFLLGLGLDVDFTLCTEFNVEYIKITILAWFEMVRLLEMYSYCELCSDGLKRQDCQAFHINSGCRKFFQMDKMYMVQM